MIIRTVYEYICMKVSDNVSSVKDKSNLEHGSSNVNSTNGRTVKSFLSRKLGNLCSSSYGAPNSIVPVTSRRAIVHVISIVMSYFIAEVKSLILLSREKYGDRPMEFQLKTYNSSTFNEYLLIDVSGEDTAHEKRIILRSFAELFNYWHL